MNAEQIKLADSEWRDTGLNNRIQDMQGSLAAIANMNTLTPEDWEKIIDKTDDLVDDAEKINDYAIEVHQRMIGD